jgi:hypothetical protein
MKKRKKIILLEIFVMLALGSKDYRGKHSHSGHHHDSHRCRIYGLIQAFWTEDDPSSRKGIDFVWDFFRRRSMLGKETVLPLIHHNLEINVYENG